MKNHAFEYTPVEPMQGAKSLRRFLLGIVLVGALVLLGASWIAHGEDVAPNAQKVAKEIGRTVKQATRPVKRAFRDAKRALKSL